MPSQEWSNRCLQCCADIRAFTGLDCRLVDTSAKRIVHGEDAPPDFCSRCTYIRCLARSTHSYGCNEAYRWGGHYLYYCPLGLAFVAGCLCDTYGALVGGISVGPFISGDRGETLEQISEATRAVKADDLPECGSQMQEALGRQLKLLCCGLMSPYSWENVPKEASLPVKPHAASPADFQLHQQERRLEELLRACDKDGSREMLHTMFSDACRAGGGDLELVKQGAAGIAGVISRACFAQGVDVKEVFGQECYLEEIQRFRSVEPLYNWISAIFRRFLDYAFEFQQAKHSNVLFNVKKYICQHYAEKIPLEALAAQVYLSPGYLSTLFKEETGESLVSFINRTRIDKSREFLLEKKYTLLDVAQMCGFEDQNYFARVFKKQVGVSPKKYRDTSGRII